MLGPVGMITFYIYMLVILLVGVVASRYVKNLSDYYVSGRNAGTFVIFGTYGATTLSAGSFIGTTGFNYAFGWSAAVQLGGSILAAGILGILFAHKFWRFGHYQNGYTVPDIFAARYAGKASRGISAIYMLLLYAFGLSAMNMGFATVMGHITGMSFEFAVILGAVVFISYTALGGMRAVAWSDTLQFVVMIAGTVIALPLALSAVGGWDGMVTQLANVPAPPAGLNYNYGEDLLKLSSAAMPLGLSIGWFLVWGLGNPSQPHMATRAYLGKNIKSLRIGIAFATLFFVLIYIVGLIVASSSRILFPALERMDMAYPVMITSVMHPIAGALVMGALIAAIMSTSDTILMMCAQAVSHDIYRSIINPDISDKTVFKMSRITIVVIGAISIVVAFLARNIPGLLFLWGGAFATLACAYFPSLILGFYWKRATKEANIASMLIGGLTAFIFYAFPTVNPIGIHPIIPGLIISFTVFIVVSLVTPKPSDEIVEKFFNPVMTKWF